MPKPWRLKISTFTLFLVLPFARTSAGERGQSFKDLRKLVDQRVAEWQPTADEKRFDQIGWCTSLLEAEKLARQHHRPIFLFTHDGRMNVGRC
jgi:hypothetical protein